MYFKELQSDYIRISTNIRDRFLVLEETRKELGNYRGSMRWKSSKGRQYLFRASDNHGNGRSMGVRSPETERVLEGFLARKALLVQREREVLEWLQQQAAFAKAARINRCPRLVSRILRELQRDGLLGSCLLVVGSHALLAYEAEAGVLFDSDLLATLDLDLLLDLRVKLVLSEDARQKSVLAALQRADRSFAPLTPRSFRASNSKGFLVDLIKPQARPPWKPEVGAENINPDDLWASPIANLDWLRDAPKLETILIDEDGFPLRVTVADPRAFALHKLWVSDQPSRKRDKARRDQQQAIAVATLVAKHMPHLPLIPELLRQIPLEHARILPELPSGF